MTFVQKVSIIECRNYDYELVKNAIKRSFKNLGGIDKYINKGDKVLLKVNLLMRKAPEKATTTHPVFVKALAEILINYGAEVIIGDSPGGPFNKTILKGIYKICGMEEAAFETGAKLNYNTASVQKENPDALLLKKLIVTDMLNDVDKIISVSKLKTHGMMVFTGAVKNMFGIIPGITKAEYHVNMPELDRFADALIDICMCANPVLSFMDGIVGMEGAGPSGGEPREVGVVLASGSPYHLDKAAINIISLKPHDVPTVKRSIERGICSEGFEDIEFLVDEKSEDRSDKGKADSFFLDKFIIHDYKTAKVVDINFLNYVPKFIRKFLERQVKPIPVFDLKKCVGCGDCAANCPAKVIKMRKGKPKADISGCIRCFCCQELCPKVAVEIYRPVIMRLLFGKK